MREVFLDGRVTLYPGDCLDVLASLPENSVDSVVCDPPYHLTSNKKGGTGEASLNLASPAGRSRVTTGGGFMGKQWDGGDIAFQPATWAAVWRVLKPGGHLLAFSATRSYHRMAVAIEDGGFEIRDQIGYAFGSGFPKSHSITKAAAQSICRCGAETLRQRDLRSVRDAGLQAPKPYEAERRDVLFDGVSQQGAPHAAVRGRRHEMTSDATGIPADVMKAARSAIMAEVNPEVRWQYADGRRDHLAVVMAIANAIMAERKRCVDIAKGEWMTAGLGEYGSGQADAANAIAEEILRG